MISREELKDYAKLKGYNLGQAEKDYFQEIILFILYSEFGKELVFKGGTALTKCYGFDRFSEDLDFTGAIDKDLDRIISKGLRKFYIDFESKKIDNKLVYRINGPLYANHPNTSCKIIIDIRRESVILEPAIKRIGLHIKEIPMFDVVVMAEPEIFAEKIRAIFKRDKARDMYDLFYLVKRGVKPDLGLINKKLSFYSMEFTITGLREALEKKRPIWDKELRHLVRSFPGFSEAKRDIHKHITGK